MLAHPIYGLWFHPASESKYKKNCIITKNVHGNDFAEVSKDIFCSFKIIM